ncbi:hypothetical protein CHUAL_000222 [Chamberlinius hualienensis]
MASNVSVCELDATLKEAIKKFRFRREKDNAALLMKIDREKHLVCLDEIMNDVDVDTLRESLPSHQPRFVLYSYKLEYSDGRVAYPLCFIFLTPQDSHPELQMMYAGTKLSVVKESDIGKVFEIRDLDDLTTEWLEEKLQKN